MKMRIFRVKLFNNYALLLFHQNLTYRSKTLLQVYNLVLSIFINKTHTDMKGAGFVASVYEPELGKFKVPTLRNVDKRPNTSCVKAYGHNGYFKSLEDIVHFYNTRDVSGAGWPASEYAVTMTSEVG